VGAPGLIPRAEGRPEGRPQDQGDIKTLIVPGMLFEALGIPVFRTRRWAQRRVPHQNAQGPFEFQGPLLLHVITEKGKGFVPAAQDSTRWPRSEQFRQGAGRQREEKRRTRGRRTPRFSATPWSNWGENPKIVRNHRRRCRTGPGSGVRGGLPQRFFDVGIAEQHAITFAAGLATQGMIP